MKVQVSKSALFHMDKQEKILKPTMINSHVEKNTNFTNLNNKLVSIVEYKVNLLYVVIVFLKLEVNKCLSIPT